MPILNRRSALRTSRSGSEIGVGRRATHGLTVRQLRHFGEHSLRGAGDLSTIYTLNWLRPGAAHALPSVSKVL